MLAASRARRLLDSGRDLWGLSFPGVGKRRFDDFCAEQPEGAEAMRAKELSRGPHGRTFVLVFEHGDEVMETLERWCRDEGVMAARLTGVGAFERATVAWFDWERREYRDIPVSGQVELLALNGDVAEQDGEPAVHAHVVLGTRDGTARGGHLRSAIVRPTLELIVDEQPAHLRKRLDPESGLALIDPAP